MVFPKHRSRSQGPDEKMFTNQRAAFLLLFCFALLLGFKKKKIPVHVYAFRYPHVCRLKTKWLSHTMYKKKIGCTQAQYTGRTLNISNFYDTANQNTEVCSVSQLSTRVTLASVYRRGGVFYPGRNSCCNRGWGTLRDGFNCEHPPGPDCIHTSCVSNPD